MSFFCFFFFFFFFFLSFFFFFFLLFRQDKGNKGDKHSKLAKVCATRSHECAFLRACARAWTCVCMCVFAVVVKVQCFTQLYNWFVGNIVKSSNPRRHGPRAEFPSSLCASKKLLRDFYICLL
jgi:hypothetical protein